MKRRLSALLPVASLALLFAAGGLAAGLLVNAGYAGGGDAGLKRRAEFLCHCHVWFFLSLGWVCVKVLPSCTSRRRA